MSLRSATRAAVPGPLRLLVARMRRGWRDRSGRVRITSTAGDWPQDFPHLVATVVQEIKPSPFLAGKLANVRLGASRIDRVVVASGDTFSFWHLVGPPTAAAGFAIGRSIRGGIAGGDVGGGLCQLSGIIYEAGLRAGLTPTERHPHSRDLYTEAERFTPLGLDATVVWPYKDLRLANPFATAIRFRIVVSDGTLTAEVDASEPLGAARIEIERVDGAETRQVRVIRRLPDGAVQAVSNDRYNIARC